MLREIGLGLVLLLGGDGDMSRRAGDALIQDKVDDALTEGGFDSITYRDWERGFQGSQFWMTFHDIDVVREGTRLSAALATVYPISVRMHFSSGTVEALSEAYAWRFKEVDVSGTSSFFTRSVAIHGRDLELVSGETEIQEAFCLFESGCPYQVTLGGASLSEFGLELTRKGSEAELRFVWQEEAQCIALNVTEITFERGAALSRIGRDLLKEDAAAKVLMKEGQCQRYDRDGPHHGQLVGVDNPANTPLEVSWSARDRRLDDVLQILLVSVPEAYEFLVD